MKLERLAVLASSDFGRLSFGNRTVAIAPAAHDIETFERESRRVHLAVTRCAAGIITMFLQLLPNCHRATDVGLDCSNWRWWRNVDAENSLHDPFPPKH